jgi:hypothetical protein
VHPLVLPVLVCGDRAPVFRPGTRAVGFVGGDRRADRIRPESGGEPKGPEERSVGRFPALSVPVLCFELFRSDQGEGVLSAVSAGQETAAYRQHGVPRIRRAGIRLPPACAPLLEDQRNPGLICRTTHRRSINGGL